MYCPNCKEEFPGKFCPSLMFTPKSFCLGASTIFVPHSGIVKLLNKETNVLKRN